LNFKSIIKIKNITNLINSIRVYNTVIKSISCINETKYRPLKYELNKLETEQLMDSFRRVLLSVTKVSNTKFNELLYGPINLCMELFYDIFNEKIFQEDPLIAELLIKQNKCDSIWVLEVDISFLKILSKVKKNTF